MKLLTLCLCLTLAASAAAAADSPGARQLALAHRVAAWYGPVLAQGSATTAVMSVEGAWSEAAAAPLFPPGQAPPSHWRLPLTPLDMRQLNTSLAAAADEATPQVTDALTPIFARAYDTKTLEALADFFEQPAERALQTDRQQVMVGMQEPAFDLTEAQMHGTAGLAEAERGLAAVAKGIEGLNRLAHDPRQVAEERFMKTPAFRAFSSDDPGRAAAVRAAARAVWPDIVASAQSDYCAHRPCDASLHAFFKALADYDRLLPVETPGDTAALRAVLGTPPQPPAPASAPH